MLCLEVVFNWLHIEGKEWRDLAESYMELSRRLSTLGEAPMRMAEDPGNAQEMLREVEVSLAKAWMLVKEAAGQNWVPQGQGHEGVGGMMGSGLWNERGTGPGCEAGGIRDGWSETVLADDVGMEDVISDEMQGDTLT